MIKLDFAANARLSGQKLLVIMWSEAEPNQLFLFRLKLLLNEAAVRQKKQNTNNVHTYIYITFR